MKKSDLPLLRNPMECSAVVIKLGGKTLTEEKKKDFLLKKIVGLSRKSPLVLVHGGGPEITQYLKKIGIKSRFVGGLRYTDTRTMEYAEMLLSGKINKDLVNRLNFLGRKSGQTVRAVGLSGKDAGMVIVGKVKGLGLVGEPKKIDTNLLKVLLKEKIVPVISSIGIDDKGVTLNINADTLASALAISLNAKILIFLTDKPGILKTVKGKLKTIKKVRLNEINKLFKEKIISEGMIPKLMSAGQAIRKGVGKVLITDGKKKLNSGTEVIR